MLWLSSWLSTITVKNNCSRSIWCCFITTKPAWTKLFIGAMSRRWPSGCGWHGNTGVAAQMTKCHDKVTESSDFLFIHKDACSSHSEANTQLCRFEPPSVQSSGSGPKNCSLTGSDVLCADSGECHPWGMWRDYVVGQVQLPSFWDDWVRCVNTASRPRPVWTRSLNNQLFTWYLRLFTVFKKTKEQDFFLFCDVTHSLPHSTSLTSDGQPISCVCIVLGNALVGAN